MRCLHDRDEIAAFLVTDRWLHLYELGDLDPLLWGHTTWYGLDDPDAPGGLETLALVYSGGELPTLLALSRPGHAQTRRLLSDLQPVLPHCLYAHLGPGLSDVFDGPDWTLEARGTHRKMALQSQISAPARSSVRLGPADAARLSAFYERVYPENFFDPRMLQTGSYVGIEQSTLSRQLIAAAGVHVLSEQQGVAALGNIAVDPAHRGRGLGRAVTAAACVHLQSRVRWIGLNVEATNQAAIRCYTRLGFTHIGDYEEWVIQRRAQ